MRRIVILNDYTSNPRVTISRRNIRSYLHCTRFAMASLTTRISASSVAVDRRKPIPLSFNQLLTTNALFVSRLVIASLTARFSASCVAVTPWKPIPSSVNQTLTTNALFHSLRPKLACVCVFMYVCVCVCGSLFVFFFSNASFTAFFFFAALSRLPSLPRYAIESQKNRTTLQNIEGVCLKNRR